MKSFLSTFAAACLLVSGVAANDATPINSTTPVPTSTPPIDPTQAPSPTLPPTPTPTPTPPYTVFHPVCVVERNFDFVGNDIANVPAVNVGECCEVCAFHDGCGAYTWSPYKGGTCWLKSGRGEIVASLGLHSGLGKLTSAPSTCSVEIGIDYEGFDTNQVKSPDATGCCDICQSYFNCRAYSWSNFNGGTCFLKSKRGPRIQKAGVMSAQVYPQTEPVPRACFLDEGIDFVGGDIGSKPSKTAGGCCAICDTTSGCVAYSWTNFNGGTCFLKDRIVDRVRASGVVSSEVFPRTQPPTPTPTPAWT